MRSTSCSFRLVDAVIVIACLLPVALSLALTFRMPFASMSNVTSTCGTPRGAGGMPSRLNWPSEMLSAAMGRSPCSTCTVTADWPSSAVLKIWLWRTGMVVLRSMRGVITPPRVSMPSVSGVTSSKSTSLTSPASTPACTAAPTATTSSGLTDLLGSLPAVSLRTSSWIMGMRVAPPTSTTSSSWLADNLASLSACSTGPTQRCTRSSVNCSSLARVNAICKCLGPLMSAVIKGRLTSVSLTVESSILAFSAASCKRCSAWRSWPRSMPWSFLNSRTMCSTTRRSQSSPPKKVSPLVERTSTTPSPTSRMETSKVPPPRSKTMIVSDDFLSRP